MAIKTKTDARPTALLATIFGEGGTGKTSLAASAPGPVLFLDTDRGAQFLGVTSIDVADHWPDIIDALREFAADPGDCKTLVIDALGSLETISVRHTCEVGGKPDLLSFAFGKGYVFKQDLWIDLFQILRGLTRQGINVILISHQAVLTEADPLNGEHATVGLSCHKRIAGLIHSQSDIVGCLQVKKIIRDVGSEGKPLKTSMAIEGADGAAVRELIVAPGGPAQCKNRMGITAPIEIPAVDGWKSFTTAVRASLGTATKKGK